MPVPRFDKPAQALLIAVAGYAVAALVVSLYPGLRLKLWMLPAWLAASIDLVVISAPLVAAVIVAARIGAMRGLRRALRPTGMDVALGLCAAAATRAVVEIITPTTGILLGPFVMDLTPDVIAGLVSAVIGLVLITPVVEELFFRGLLLRTIDDVARPVGRIASAGLAVIVSTVAFWGLHVVAAGDVTLPEAAATVAVGLTCGILTVVTGRIGAAVIAHIGFNLLGVVLLSI